MILNVIPEANYVRIEISGHETEEDAQTFLDAASGVISESSKGAILVSSTNLSPLPLVDLYVLARQAFKTRLRNCKIAFLYDLDDLSELNRFVDAVAEGYGLQLAVFRTVSEAAQWLTNGRPAKHEG